MKKYVLLSFLVALILVATILPTGFLSASPGNLVKNGGFDDGLNCWKTQNDVLINPSFGKPAPSVKLGPKHISYVLQGYNICPIKTSNKDLILSCDIYPLNEVGDLLVGFTIYKGGSYLFPDSGSWQSINSSANNWYKFSMSISEMWQNQYSKQIPDFDEIQVYVQLSNGRESYVDNIKLAPASATSEEKSAKPIPWVRDKAMTCQYVWVNQNGDFQFSFIYPYADNNWVRIYDMSGNLVYEIDMPYDDPNITVDLPDGLYTVKTFHDQPEPIHTFIIGKP